MNDKFDELTKTLAQAVSRRAALKKFGAGLAGMALACFGLANQVEASGACKCVTNADCKSGDICATGVCIPSWCDRRSNPCCCRNRKSHLPSCVGLAGNCGIVCHPF